MSFTYPSLPFLWQQRLQQIEQNCHLDWKSAVPDPIRVQHPDTWHSLRLIQEKLASTLLSNTASLTAPEFFLLFAAAELYETGWTIPYAQSLPIKQRYIEGGCLIRNSARTGGGIIDLSFLEPLTLNALACICSAPGRKTLTSLSMDAIPVGLNEMARLRLLCALFQLADYLCIDRIKKRTISSISNFSRIDPLDARLLLKPYIPYIDIRREGIKATFELHPDDSPLASRIQALFEEPLYQWWEDHGPWLSETYAMRFPLQTAEVIIENSGAAPEPLIDTCPALISILKHFSPLAHRPASEDRNVAVATQALSTPQVNVLPDFTPPARVERTRAFISYSCEDIKYLRELRQHLKPFIREGSIDPWDNTEYIPGELWHDKLNEMLSTTKVAILLVSKDFLASDHIFNDELLPLLKAAQEGGATILSVIIGASAFDASPLVQFRPMNSLNKPLNTLNKGDRDKIWSHVARTVKSLLSPP